MFSLLSGMWMYFFSIPQYNVLVLGLDNAGKSTFLYQVGTICNRKNKSKQTTPKYKKSPPNELNQPTKPKLKRKSSDNPDSNNTHIDPNLRKILPTMGQNVKLIEFDNMTLQFWDLPGQTGFRKIWTHYYRECHAIVFMIDSADTNRLNEAKYELHKLLNEYELKYAPFLILANKQDLKNAIHYQSVINTLQITLDISNTNNIITDEKQNENENILGSIDETKQQYYTNTNNNGFKDRSIKVMCTCCVNKDGLSDAISWLVYTIPLAKQRLHHVAQNLQKEMEQKNK